MKTTTIKLIALSLIIIMMLTSGTYAVAASPTLPLVDGEYLPVEDTSYEFATISSSTNSDMPLVHTPSVSHTLDSSL